jgi:diadenosine tetraphosphate (Ap4A) HIT family hydrolase
VAEILSAVAGCVACDLYSGARPLPGGQIHETAGWVVEHCIGPLGVGTVVVKPSRHVVHVADLTDAESVALGPLLRRTAAAVERVVQPDQVYVCLWSHSGGAPGHIHFVVQPVTTADMERFGAHGPALQLAMFSDGTLPEQTDIETVCDRLRTAFAEPGRDR